MSKFRSFGAPSPKAFIEKLEANDPATTSVDLSNNALFKMKSYEYLGKIAEAMKTNTNCKELILKSNDITNADCEHIKTLLSTNKTLTSLNLEGNKIDSEGSKLIAEGVKVNSTLTTLILLGNGPFGEGCMDAWLDAFLENVTLTNLKWRLDSRKSFKLNKDITRNNSIERWKRDGKDWESLLPDHLKPRASAASFSAAATAGQEAPDIEKKVAAVAINA
mmetsp:Transcript_24877/g.74631  ORF Transcript_24877/g.74631 Transcript_24877/m.74631 type:complete len:220 (+) Transcript_24877:134-793(+)